MKELTKYSRLAGYLEKLYDKLNADFFGGELDRPVITIQSTSRAYGHYTLYDAWSVKGNGFKEINIATGTLNRPIEETIATLLHEMCHQYNDEIANIQDCSRKGTYHNQHFLRTAQAHGLAVSKSDKYGWCRTAPSDNLLEWILVNDIQEIKLNRNEWQGFCLVGGNASLEGGAPRTTSKAHNYRYECPCCHAIARSGKLLHLVCGDCNEGMSTLI